MLAHAVAAKNTNIATVNNSLAIAIMSMIGQRAIHRHFYLLYLKPTNTKPTNYNPRVRPQKQRTLLPNKICYKIYKPPITK
jgi:hypothetical protein